jgi:hypothetical protein
MGLSDGLGRQQGETQQWTRGEERVKEISEAGILAGLDFRNSSEVAIRMRAQVEHGWPMPKA